MRRPPNELVIVPNAKLAGAVTTNHHLPDPEDAVMVNVGVRYDSDIAQVERVTVVVVREVKQEVPGDVPGFTRSIRYNASAASSGDSPVILRAREVVEQHLIRHESTKRLHKGYRGEGIEVSFPRRTLGLSERAEAALSRRHGTAADAPGRRAARRTLKVQPGTSCPRARVGLIRRMSLLCV
ncbi:MAG: mechanosensitive ion channel family protein [Planctomycetes bacterium]|nr:mechanosensitive ion channel family protein [Planctomycetota bacterium]